MDVARALPAILVAGASTRMVGAKAALPIRDRADTFLSRLIRSFSRRRPALISLGERGGAGEVRSLSAGPILAPSPVRTYCSLAARPALALLVGLNHVSVENLEAMLTALVDCRS